MEKTVLDRGAGILMPISSLPSPYGIGTFGQSAREFADCLAAAGQKYWQVLPMGPTSYGDSPYAALSAFAGNPYFIDLNELRDEGLLTQEEIDGIDWGDHPDRVDYEMLYRTRFTLLRSAYIRSGHRDTEKYTRFLADNAFWLEDYALYMAVKNAFGGRPWTEWEEDIRVRDPEAVREYQEKYAEDIDFWKFLQYKFFQQWRDLKTYISGKGIRVIGDIPLYVAMDSADVWCHPELFQLDRKTLVPTEVAGVPPDAFTSDGQLWGNPLYNWTLMAKDGFSWWQNRMQANAALYDFIRIDHFIGIVQYYAIPYGEKTARNGRWRKGPGARLIAAVKRALNGTETGIIAEDLGVAVPEMDELLEKNHFPGMKIIEFAFSGDRRNPHLPHNYVPNSVVYGGTHDNETLAGDFRPECREWWELQYICDYLGASHQEEVPNLVFRAAYESVASAAIFQMQDVLGLDNRARMNTPGKLGGNWEWRMLPGQFNEERIGYLRRLADIYGR